MGRRGGSSAYYKQQRTISEDVHDRESLTVDTNILVSNGDKYVRELAGMDMRVDCGEQCHHGKKQKRTTTATASKSGNEPQCCEGNRPHFTKNDPSKCKEPGWVPETFTVTELNKGFSGNYDIAFMARVWLYAKCTEDDMQELIDPLPPGLKIHRLAGAGARTSPGDGLPGNGFFGHGLLGKFGGKCGPWGYQRSLYLA